MEYKLKAVTPQLLKQALEVEAEAMGDHCYLEQVYDYFKSTQGELTTAFAGDEMVGIGKLTVLWDGSAWLETLRVKPSWQRKGVGVAIYKRYLEQIEQMGCGAVAMYTGKDNVSSAQLARRFGLEVAAQFREYVLPDFDEGTEQAFRQVEASEAVRLMEPYFAKYNNYVVMNRTYYRLNHMTCQGLAQAGRVYYSDVGETLLVAGARFQQEKALHVAMVEGDKGAGLAFAKQLAKKQGAPKIVCNFALQNTELEEALKSNGFINAVEDFITMEASFAENKQK